MFLDFIILLFYQPRIFIILFAQIVTRRKNEEEEEEEAGMVFLSFMKNEQILREIENFYRIMKNLVRSELFFYEKFSYS